MQRKKLHKKKQFKQQCPTFYWPFFLGMALLILPSAITVEDTTCPPIMGKFSCEQVLFPNTEILSMTLGAKYRWVGTKGKGLARVNRKTKQVLWYTKETGHLSHNNINTLLNWSKDHLLIGTPQGLVQLNKNNNETILFHADSIYCDLPSSHITCLERIDKKNVVIGTTKGVVRWRPYLSRTSFQSTFVTSATLSSMLPLRGNDYGIKKDTFMLPTNAWTVYNQANTPLEDEHITTLCYTNELGLFVGTRNGGVGKVEHITTKQPSWKLFTTTNSALPDISITALSSNDNSIYIGTQSGYFIEFDGVNIKHGQSTILDDQTSGRTINNIHVSGDHIYLATKGEGLIQFPVHPTTNEWEGMTIAHDADCFISSYINTVVGDGEALWLGTEQGVFKQVHFCDIYPGDANRDGVVNHYDLLMLGLAMNEEGAERYDNHETFKAQCGTVWNDSIANVNLAYVDMNGDGAINALDSITLMKHFEK